MRARFRTLALIGTAWLGIASGTAHAQTAGSNEPVFTRSWDDLTVTGNFIGELAAVNNVHTGFGAGSADLNGVIKYNDVSAIEWFGKPQLVFLYDPGPYDIYARASASIAGTYFQGDAQFPTDGTYYSPMSANLEEGVVGIRSGYSFLDWGIGDSPDMFDLSYGPQDFYIGDGFLLQQGVSEGERHAAYWSGIRTAFKNTAVLRINTKPIRADIYQLQTNYNQDALLCPTVCDFPNFRLYGINLEWYDDTLVDGILTKKWVYGFNFMHIYDADDGLGTSNTYSSSNGSNRLQFDVPSTYSGVTRNGMNVFDFHSQGHLIEQLPDLWLSGEFVYENNPNEGQVAGTGLNRNLNAYAYYAEAAYNTSTWPWNPTFGYRYAFFSGQKPDTNHSTSFDPLAYGYSYAPSRNVYGTWVMGEIIGEDYLFNSNEIVNMAYIKTYPAFPSYDWTFTTFLYHFDFDQLPFSAVNATIPDTSKNAFDEIDLEVDWYPAAHTWLGITGIVGFAFAEDGGHQWIDNTEAQCCVTRTGSTPFSDSTTQALAEFLVYLNF